MTDDPDQRTAPDDAAQQPAGPAPIAVVMISLNEAHNMAAVLENLRGFAAEVFLVDSYSSDATVEIALAHGVHVVQRRFPGFGDQWNFAMRELPITAPWTMKLDPDERLDDALKRSIRRIIADDGASSFTLRRRLWFMGRELPVVQVILRGWRTGSCRFSDTAVNEHPLVAAGSVAAAGELAHHDSPDLHHWFDKQNRYTTAEAAGRYHGMAMAVPPRLFGGPLARRMWLKANYARLPFRHQIFLAYHLYRVRVWRTGRAGYAWARLRVWYQRTIELKLAEMERLGRSYAAPEPATGRPHPVAMQAEDDVAAARARPPRRSSGRAAAP